MFKNIFSYLPKNKRKYLLKDSNHFSSSPYYVKSNPPYFSISEIIVNRLKEDENKNINSITNIRLYVPPFDAPVPGTDGIKLFAELVYPELKGTSGGKSLEKESVETREGQGLSPSYDAAAAEKTAVGSVEMLNTFKSYGKILTLEDEEMKRSFAEMLSAGAADISYIKQVEMLLSSF